MSKMMNIEGYKVMRKLGAGAYGSVYEAKKDGDKTGKSVAVKVFCGLRGSWKKEVNMLEASERCEGVIKMKDCWEDVDNLYIAMEMGGKTLDAIFKKTPAKPQEARSSLYYSLKALWQLHKVNILHGDLKSNNVVVSDKPKNGFPIVLIDLGLARTTDGDFCSFRPQAWQVQCLPSKNFRGGFYGERSEVYSLVYMIVQLLDVDLYNGLELEENNRDELINMQEQFENNPKDVLNNEELSFLVDFLIALNKMDEFAVDYEQLLEILKNGCTLKKFWKKGKGCVVM